MYEINVIIKEHIIDNQGLAYMIMLVTTIVYFILTLVYSIRLFIRNKEEYQKIADMTKLASKKR